MNFFVPKSYKVKHKILELLSKKRMVNGGLDPRINWCLTVRTISNLIGEDLKYVHSQIDYLFYKKYIYTLSNDEEKTNPLCYVSDSGIELYSSYSYLNDGKLLQTTLFNNLSTGFFQIVVGVIVVVTLVYNYEDSKLYHQEVQTISKEVWDLKNTLKEYQKDNSTTNFNNNLDYPNNSQKEKIKKDTL